MMVRLIWLISVLWPIIGPASEGLVMIMFYCVYALKRAREAVR